MAKFRRKRYFINSKLQIKYFLLSIMMLLLYTMFFVAILLTPYVIPLYYDYPLQEQTQAARMLLTLHKSIWPALGIVILVLSSLSIFITHKIAGPIYRFRTVITEVSGGNLDINVRLRKRDEFKDLAEGLNVVVGELRVCVDTMQGGHETLTACISELENQIREKKMGSEVGLELIARMRAHQVNMAQILDKYPRSAKI